LLLFLTICTRYTKEQQKRLGVDKHGNKIATISRSVSKPAQKQKEHPVENIAPRITTRGTKPSPVHSPPPSSGLPVAATPSPARNVGQNVQVKRAAPLPVSAVVKTKTSHPASPALAQPSATSRDANPSSDVFDNAQRSIAVYHAAKAAAVSAAAAARAAEAAAAAAVDNASDLAHVAEAEAVKVNICLTPMALRNCFSCV
jgi:hypothetical protein